MINFENFCEELDIRLSTGVAQEFRLDHTIGASFVQMLQKNYREKGWEITLSEPVPHDFWLHFRPTAQKQSYFAF